MFLNSRIMSKPSDLVLINLGSSLIMDVDFKYAARQVWGRLHSGNYDYYYDYDLKLFSNYDYDYDYDLNEQAITIMIMITT